MNKRRFALIPAVVLLIALPVTALAASVKKKNGEVVEGKIQARIVQRQAKEGSVSYVIRKGSDITAIDEQGVHFKKGSKVDDLTIFMEGKSATEIEALGGKGGFVLHITGETKEAATDSNPLLGEYRGDASRKEIKGVIFSVINIQTKTGIVTIPVEEIVEFAKQP
ncbi:MAG TPA: hypothetical protein VJH03_12710 [Blastocatellia bacterium]|nr:hypothetical protein [Blastocatellia bacterium]